MCEAVHSVLLNTGWLVHPIFSSAYLFFVRHVKTQPEAVYLVKMLERLLAFSPYKPIDRLASGVLFHYIVLV